MMFYAHSTSAFDRHDWQTLPDHLHAVSELAAKFGYPLGIDRAARVAGAMHDLGKYTPKFLARLSGAPIKVDHSTAGAYHILQLATGQNRRIAELIAYTIAGHHAGLPDQIGIGASLTDRLAKYADETLDPVWRHEVAVDASDLVPKFDFTPKTNAGPFRLAFLGRMIFSCLVDADYRDTEAFYARAEKRTQDRDWSALTDILPELVTRFDRHMNALPRSDSKVNRLRDEILATVRANAALLPGLFTLTVPTGGGKTLASLGFALDHVTRHRSLGLRRIIYAIPYTAIIDQTADIFRAVLGDDVLLEHHSAIEEEPAENRQQRDKLKLAMEDWAAPVIVTTTVQFFESLFGARPSRCRKLHNIAGSVIILDEAQTLPRHLLAPAVRALDELARNYKCSIVLCTATQPALDARDFSLDHPMGLNLEGRELAPEPARLASELRRVTIRPPVAMTNVDLIADITATSQGLVIVNSRRHALELYQQARQAGLDGLVHLTTRQYAAHRRVILAEIRQRLKHEQPCRVIATSLVEAGVDLDFPRVWRAEAGLDQIAQAAGRCNRNGSRSIADSIVTLFVAADYPAPPEIRALSADFLRMAGRHTDLLSPDAIRDFFAEVYWRVGKGLDRERILDRFTTDRSGTNFAYRSVAEAFRMIESDMAPVIIARDPAARSAVAKLSVPQIPPGLIARELQSYLVQIPPKARRLLLDNGHVRFAAAELRGDQFAVLQTESFYEPDKGLIWENADYLGMEQSVV